MSRIIITAGKLPLVFDATGILSTSLLSAIYQSYYF